MFIILCWFLNMHDIWLKLCMLAKYFLNHWMDFNVAQVRRAVSGGLILFLNHICIFCSGFIHWEIQCIFFSPFICLDHKGSRSRMKIQDFLLPSSSWKIQSHFQTREDRTIPPASDSYFCTILIIFPFCCTVSWLSFS